MPNRSLFLIPIVMLITCIYSKGSEITPLPTTLQPAEALISVYEKDPPSSDYRDYPAFLVNVGRSYIRLSKFDKAEAVFRKLIRLYPSIPIGHRDLGQTLQLEKKGDLGMGEFKIGWNLGDVQSLKELSVCYFDRLDSNAYKGIIKDLLLHKNEDVDIVKYLISYSIWMKDKPVFNQTVSGLDPDVLQDAQVSHFVEVGEKTFK